MGRSLLLAFTLTLLYGISVADEHSRDVSCEKQITSKFSYWHAASVSADIAEWARSQHFDPTRIKGDFDNNGLPDIALLIEPEAPSGGADGNRKHSSIIAVCLGGPDTALLHIIERPYCDDYIALTPKGRSYYDWETGTTGTYPVDGIAAVCFEQAGATYLYTGTTFRAVVDSD